MLFSVAPQLFWVLFSIWRELYIILYPQKGFIFKVASQLFYNGQVCTFRKLCIFETIQFKLIRGTLPVPLCITNAAFCLDIGLVFVDARAWYYHFKQLLMLACFPVNLMLAIDSSTWFKRLKTLLSNFLVEVSLKTEAFLSNVSEALIFKLFSMCFQVLQDVGSFQMDMRYPRTSSITVLKFCWPFILARLDALPYAFIGLQKYSQHRDDNTSSPEA